MGAARLELQSLPRRSPTQTHGGCWRKPSGRDCFSGNQERVERKNFFFFFFFFFFFWRGPRDFVILSDGVEWG